MKKLLLSVFATALAIVCLMLVMPAYADTVNEPEVISSAVEAEVQEDTPDTAVTETPAQSADTALEGAQVTDEPSGDDNSNTGETGGGFATFGEWIVDRIYYYRNEIITVIVGIFSLITLFLQKVRILPRQDAFIEQTGKNLNGFAKSVENYQNSISASVVQIGEKVDENSEATLAAVRNTEEVMQTVVELQRRQDQVSAERNAVKSVLKMQEEMLNTIIQASTLAQWKKDQIGKWHSDNMAIIESLPGGEASKEGVVDE